MNSVASIRLCLALVASAVIIQLLVQPVSSSHSTHHKGDGKQKSKENEENVHQTLSSHTHHREHTLKVLKNQPLEYSPVCRWCHDVNFDRHRIPKFLPTASCCNTDLHVNITGDTGLFDARCETIHYSLLVKLKSRHPNEAAHSWKDTWLKVPAGCTPANQA